MTTLGKLTRKIKAWRKLGASYETVGAALHISKADARRLTLGQYPGEKVAARLGLPVKCHACKRKLPAPRKPRKAQPKIGRDPNWMDHYLKVKP